MLRKKIEPDAADPTIIETVRGVGYRFRGDPSISAVDGGSGERGRT